MWLTIADEPQDFSFLEGLGAEGTYWIEVAVLQPLEVGLHDALEQAGGCKT